MRRRDERAVELARQALDALAAGEWYEAYLRTSEWGNEADGVWVTDTWLLLSACDVVNGHRRGTVHPLNLGLRDWIDRPGDRTVLFWARGQLLLSRMEDPAAAMADLDRAAAEAPQWLLPHVDAARSNARSLLDEDTAAAGGPVRGGVEPAPPFASLGRRPPKRRPEDGTKPLVFDELLTYFLGRPLRAVT